MLSGRVGPSPLRLARRVPRLAARPPSVREQRLSDGAPTNLLDTADHTTNLSGAARLLRDKNWTAAHRAARGRSTPLPLERCNPAARRLLQNRRYAGRDRHFCWDAQPAAVGAARPFFRAQRRPIALHRVALVSRFLWRRVEQGDPSTAPTGREESG